MSNEQLSAHLKRLEIFQDLDDQQLAEIARRADKIVYKSGQLLVADGEPGDAAVLVISGDAIRTKGHLTATAQEPVEPGSLLGEMAMLIETDYSSTVVAVGLVRALRIRREAMLELLAADPGLAEVFVARISRRLTRIAAELRAIDGVVGEAIDAMIAPRGIASAEPALAMA